MDCPHSLISFRKTAHVGLSGPIPDNRSIGYEFTRLTASLLSANWYLALAGGLAGVLPEEAKLIERFGDEYLAYMQRTGKFLPRLALPG